MWFIGQFENGSWGFQQNEDCLKRYTSQYEAECIKDLYEGLKAASEHLDYCGYGDEWERECAESQDLQEKIEKALAKVEANNG